jgi:hypothetical protein
MENLKGNGGLLLEFLRMMSMKLSMKGSDGKGIRYSEPWIAFCTLLSKGGSSSYKLFADVFGGVPLRTIRFVI